MEKIDFFKDEMPVNADCFGKYEFINWLILYR